MADTLETIGATIFFTGFVVVFILGIFVFPKKKIEGVTNIDERARLYRKCIDENPGEDGKKLCDEKIRLVDKDDYKGNNRKYNNVLEWGRARAENPRDTDLHYAYFREHNKLTEQNKKLNALRDDIKQSTHEIVSDQSIQEEHRMIQRRTMYTQLFFVTAASTLTYYLFVGM